MEYNCEFICIGDIHLGGINNAFPNYSFDPNSLIFKALRIPFNYAKDNGIKNIILLGDIFDNPDPEQEEQKQFLEFLREYPDFRIKAVAGNHDYSSTEKLSLEMIKFTSSISEELGHVRIISKPTRYNIGGIPFSFLPWPYCQTLKSPSVNIAHIEVPGSVSDNGKKLKNGYEISNNGVWYIGHLHRHQKIGRANYPGTLFQKTFGEPLPKGFFHVKVNYENGIITAEHEFIPVKPPFQFYSLKINDVEDFKQVTLPDPSNIKQYKLWVQKNVELPPGFLEKHPNVIDVMGKLSLKEIESLEKEGFTIDDLNADFNVLDGLEDFLIQDGLDKSEAKRGYKIVENFLKG